eukprot:GILI01020670.1.p1 GENE.GILI01020670.1~~GILI01020670.1.p1  ORF type:complete len:1397 (+),score=253.92 GILI01020670.1:26-4192(+)
MPNNKRTSVSSAHDATARPSDMFSSLRFFDGFQRPSSAVPDDKSPQNGLNDDRGVRGLSSATTLLRSPSNASHAAVIMTGPNAATLPVHEYWLEHKAVLQQELLWQREGMLKEIGRADVELLAQATMLRDKASLELEYLCGDSREAVDNIVKLEQTAWKAVKRRELHLFQIQTDFNETMTTLANSFVEREFEIAARENALRDRRYQIEAWAARIHGEMMVREVNIARISREAQRDTFLLDHKQREASATQLRNLRGGNFVGGKGPHKSDSEALLLGSVTLDQKDIVRLIHGQSFTVSGCILPRAFYRRRTAVAQLSDTNLTPNSPNERSDSANGSPKALSGTSEMAGGREAEYEEIQTGISQLEGMPITITYSEGSGGRLGGTVFAIIAADGHFRFEGVTFTPALKSSTNQTTFSGTSHSVQISVPKSIAGMVQPKQITISTKANYLLVPKRRFLAATGGEAQRLLFAEAKRIMQARADNPNAGPQETLNAELEKIVNFTAGGEWQPDILALKGHITFHSIEPFGLFGTEIEITLRFTSICDNKALDQPQFTANGESKKQKNRSPLPTEASFASSHSTVVEGDFTEKASANTDNKPKETVSTPPDNSNGTSFRDGSPLEEDTPTDRSDFDFTVPLRLFGTELNQFPFSLNMLAINECPGSWTSFIQPSPPAFSRMFMKVKVPATKYNDGFEHEFEINTLEVTSSRPFFLYDAGSVGAEMADTSSKTIMSVEQQKSPAKETIGAAPVLPPQPQIQKVDTPPPPPQKPTTPPAAETQQATRISSQTTLTRTSRNASNLALRESKAGVADGQGQLHSPHAHLAFKGLSIPLHDVVIGAQLSCDGNFLAVVDARGSLRIYQKRSAASKALAISGGSPKSIAAIAALANTPQEVTPSTDKLTQMTSHTLNPATVEAALRQQHDAYYYWAELQAITTPEGQPFSAVMAWAPMSNTATTTTPPVAPLDSTSSETDPYPDEAKIAVYHPYTQTMYCWALNRLRRFVDTTRKSGTNVGLGSTPQRSSSSTSSRSSKGTAPNGPLSLDLCQSVAYTLALPEEYIVATTGRTLSASPRSPKRHATQAANATSSPNRSPSRQHLDIGDLPSSAQNTPRRSYSSVSMAREFADPQSILTEAQFVGPDTIAAVSQNCRLYTGTFKMTSISSEPEPIFELHQPLASSTRPTKLVTCLAAPPSLGAGTAIIGFSDLSVLAYSIEQRKIVYESQAVSKSSQPTSSEDATNNPLRYFGASPFADHGTFLYFAHSFGVVLLKAAEKDGSISFNATHYSSEEIAIGDPEGGFVTRLFAVVPLDNSVAALLYDTNDCFLVDFGHLRSDPSNFIVSSSVLGEEDPDVAIQSSMDFGKTVVAPMSGTGSSLVIGIDAMGPLCWQISLKRDE